MPKPQKPGLERFCENLHFCLVIRSFDDRSRQVAAQTSGIVHNKRPHSAGRSTQMAGMSLPKLKVHATRVLIYCTSVYNGVI